MITLEIDTQRGQVTVHADADGLTMLATAANEAQGGNKVLLGDPGAMLILRHLDYGPGEERDG